MGGPHCARGTVAVLPARGPEPSAHIAVRGNIVRLRLFCQSAAFGPFGGGVLSDLGALDADIVLFHEKHAERVFGDGTVIGDGVDVCLLNGRLVRAVAVRPAEETTQWLSAVHAAVLASLEGVDAVTVAGAVSLDAGDEIDTACVLAALQALVKRLGGAPERLSQSATCSQGESTVARPPKKRATSSDVQTVKPTTARSTEVDMYRRTVDEAAREAAAVAFEAGVAQHNAALVLRRVRAHAVRQLRAIARAARLAAAERAARDAALLSRACPDCEALEADVSALRGVAVSCYAVVEERLSVFPALKAENGQLSARLAEALDALRARDASLESARDELCAVRAANDELMSGLRAEIEHLLIERTSLASAIGDLRADLATQTANCAELTSTLHATCIDQDAILSSLDAMTTERNALILERDSAITERNALTTERDLAITERDMVYTERNAVILERDSAIAERDSAIAELNDAIAKRNAIFVECETAITERNNAIAQCNEAIENCKSAVIERDSAIEEARNTAVLRESELQAHCDVLEESVTDLQSTLLRRSRDMAAADAQLRVLRSALAAAEDELEALRPRTTLAEKENAVAGQVLVQYGGVCDGEDERLLAVRAEMGRIRESHARERRGLQLRIAELEDRLGL